MLSPVVIPGPSLGPSRFGREISPSPIRPLPESTMASYPKARLTSSTRVETEQNSQEKSSTSAICDQLQIASHSMEFTASKVKRFF